MPFREPKTVEEAIAHNSSLGGTVMIKYGDTDCQIGAPMSDIYQAIELLRKDPDRDGMLRSVKDLIEETYEDAMAGKVSQQEAMGLAQDIVIWFANEVIEGRSKIEDLEVVGQN